MEVAVFHKPGGNSLTTVADPKIKLATDIILRVTSTAICGSDLHILSAPAPQTTDMVMGHEFMTDHQTRSGSSIESHCLSGNGMMRITR